MAERGVRAARRAARRNGPVENAAVDIAGIVDDQIDVDSYSSSNNELLEEVVRVPHGRQDHLWYSSGIYLSCLMYNILE